MDHAKRQSIQKSDNPHEDASKLRSASKLESYIDYGSPDTYGAKQTVALKGPFSPLEMKICGLVRAVANVTVSIDENSINTVLLDDNPKDPHYRYVKSSNKEI